MLPKYYKIVNARQQLLNPNIQKNLQESFVTRIVNYTNDNPYLWAVYVVFGGLPLAFLAYYCCKVNVDCARLVVCNRYFNRYSFVQEKPRTYRFDNEASAQANNKKTDAPTADDPEESSTDEAGPSSKAGTPPKSTEKSEKAELNAVVDDEIEVSNAATAICTHLH